jgi:hypothetical protein
MNYISDRVFKIWAYTVSHSFLILRSPKIFEDVDGYSIATNHNVDIEFWGVSYLDLPNVLNGITVKKIQKNIPQRFRKYANSLDYKVFKIKSEGSVFYVVAAGYRIGKNNWDNEHRISNPNFEYDEIIGTS